MILIVEIHECISLRLVICMAPLHAIIRWSCVVQHSTTASPTCRRCPVSSVHIFIQVPRTQVGEELSHSLVRENSYYFKMQQLHPQEYVFNYHSNHCNSRKHEREDQQNSMAPVLPASDGSATRSWTLRAARMSKPPNVRMNASESSGAMGVIGFVISPSSHTMS